MQNEKTTLKMPHEWEVLLRTQLGTDGKVDRLLPLLELLSDPEHSMSELGQALIDALQRISEDLREASSLRSAHREALEQASKTNVAMSQILTEVLREQREMRQENQMSAARTLDIHGLMFTTED